jgi:hypothetical protein
VQQTLLEIRSPRFGTTALLKKWRDKVCACFKKKKGGGGGGKKGGKNKDEKGASKKDKAKSGSKKDKKAGKGGGKGGGGGDKRAAFGAKGPTKSMRAAGVSARAVDPGYEDYEKVGVVKAVVDGWLYDHELLSLKYGLLSLVTVLVGGLVLAASLKRAPELPSQDEAAALLMPQQLHTAESAAAVGAGGLDAGWVGHAFWMGCWASLFLYVAVAKWLSVGAPVSLLGCLEAVVSSSGLVPQRLRNMWAARQSARQEALGEMGLVADVPDFVHPLVAWCTLLSVGMVVALCFTLFLGAPLNGEVNSQYALWLLDLGLLYPIALGALFEFLNWRDSGWKTTAAKDDDGDGKTSCKEYCKAFLDRDGDGSVGVLEVCSSLSSTTTYTAAVVFALVQLFVWGDVLWASTATCFAGAFYIGLMLLRDWSLNDFYLSQQSEKWANNLLLVS